ncbi:MAG: hypothetical protein JXQ29_12590, partial [Planctomycetes bacterium]|nr:hypothetical protein [Planctomycetota bacterium]
LPHAERLKRDYADEFTDLFRRYYSARKGIDRGDDRPTAEDLVALKRDFEDFKRRLDNQRERIRVLEEIADVAERAVVLARHYQAGVRVVRDHAPFGPNRYILPQLEEADRQLGTALSFVLAGLDRFQEDLRGTDTPILIKTGIEQVRRIIRDVDALLADVEGAAEVRISQPGLGELTLADYLARFAEESRRTELPPLPAAPVQAAPGRGPPAGPP